MLMTWAVWQFLVHVDDNSVKHSFTAYTAMGWIKFLEKADAQFKNRQDGADICLGYHFIGRRELQHFLQLKCKYDWNLMMTKMQEKANLAQFHAAALEIKNMVNDAILT